MTPPRYIIPGATYLVTRRCSERRFFMRPSAKTNAILEFALATCARRYGIRLHAFVFLSNHYHLVLTDVEGRISDFVRDFNSLVSKTIGAELSRWDHFWDSARASLVRLIEPSDVVDKIVYTLANPVSAGLVDQGCKWPGLRRGPNDLLRTARSVKRAGRLFSRRSTMPSKSELTIFKPDGFDDLSDTEFLELVQSRTDQRERDLRQDAKLAKRGFLGRKRALSQSPFDSPSSAAPHRTLDPQIACKDTSKRVEALRALKEFVRAYRQAFIEFSSGLRDTVFPFGTWCMRRQLGVACAAESG